MQYVCFMEHWKLILSALNRLVLTVYASAHYVCLCGVSSHASSIHLNCTQRTSKLKGVLVITDQRFIDVRTEAREGAPWPRSDSSVRAEGTVS